MERELKLYRITETGAIVPFPNEVDDAQISITTFTYNAQRMAATPTITATVNYPRCLDNDWDVNVYAEYNGEKYYIRQIPSSSKDNTSVMYRHDITLYSERFILENIYLRDVDKNDDTNVIILVDLKDFIEVVNKSLTKSDVEYRIRPLEERELDAIEGSRDAKEIVFDKVYVATAIQEIYNQWNAPFYFQGKEIIIGDNTNFITPPFEYGAENSLLKIQKQNANFRKITKISGVGSDKNIPFYYPNWSQKGIIDAEPLGSNSGVLKKEMITVTDMKKFEKFMPLGDNNSVKYKSIDETQPINNGDTTSPQYKLKYINSTKIYQEFCVPFKSVRKDNSSIDIKFDVILREIMYPTKQDVKYNNIDPNVIAQSLYSPLSFSSSYIQHTQYPGFIHLQSTENSYIMNATQSDGVVYIDRRINVSLTNVGEIPEGDLLLSIVGTFTINNAIAKQEIIGTYKHYWSSGLGSSRKDYPASINEEKNKIILQITNLTFQYVTGDNTEGWYLNDTKKIELSDIGISISGTPNSTWNGEGFYQKYIDKIPTSQNLMLPLYRDSWGKRKFYKSINYPIQSTEYVDKEIGDYKGVTGIQNDAYKKEDKNYYIFETEYNDINPIEHIQEFSEIYPSIEGITNNSGQLFGEILEVAFDDNDNNEVDEEGKLIHPYFYVRIPKFDGSNGFNLFDHKIVGDNMQIAMTSGDCSACTFEIMVKTKENATEKSYEDVINPILTKDDGSLISGNWEEKTNGDFSNFIEIQQNSKENSIWLILEKDTETFNEIYPNTIDNEEKSKVIPKVGDKFVLLNIDMPKQYVLAAEEKLRAETIKFLSQNNSDKWNFSIDFSRIFLAENETIFNQLNENAKLQVTYNGATYPFYVNSYTYEVKENEALPKITVNLSEELTINRGFAQNIADGIKRELGIVDGNIVFATIVDDDEMDKKYMRKDTSDNNPNDFTFEKNVTIEGKLSAPTIESSTIQSQKYSGDSVIGSGYKLYEDENGESTLHIDNIDVRKKLKTTEFIIQQIQFQGGIVIQSAAAMECNKVETLSNGNFKCYFDTKEGSVSNQFMLNDLARCQRVGYAPKYYWRKVVEVGSDYIVLSNVTGEYEQNSDTPSEGDIIVQMGNTTNTDRQSVIEMNTVGENSPSFIMYSGINSFSLVEKDVTGIVYHQKVFDENGNVSIESYPELYSYGSMYFGDRNKQNNFIQFAPNANGTFEMLINAKTSFNGGTSDLGTALEDLLSGIQGGGINLITGSVSGKDWFTKAGVFEINNGEFCLKNTTGDVTDAGMLFSPKNLVIKAGEPYTLSFEMRASSNIGYAQIRLVNFTSENSYEVNTTPEYIEIKNEELSTEWTKYVFTFIQLKDTTQGCIRFDNDRITGNTPSELWIRKVKLEKGTIATEWCLAQEDLQEDINSLSVIVDGLNEATGALRNALNGTTEVNGGLILSNLIGMKGGDDAIINAGISGLDNWDKLRFWAGSSLDGANTAPFRVYDNGRVFGTYFYGFHSAFFLTSSNINDYIVNSNNENYIDVRKTGAKIMLDLTSITTPFGFPKETSGASGRSKSYIGSEIEIFNPNKLQINICGNNVISPFYANFQTLNEVISPSDINQSTYSYITNDKGNALKWSIRNMYACETTYNFPEYMRWKCIAISDTGLVQNGAIGDGTVDYLYNIGNYYVLWVLVEQAGETKINLI